MPLLVYWCLQELLVLEEIPKPMVWCARHFLLNLDRLRQLLL
jgi:hypothetical protein